MAKLYSEIPESCLDKDSYIWNEKDVLIWNDMNEPACFNSNE